jgi:tetratricopeptide (TPR) repeat protein
MRHTERAMMPQLELGAAHRTLGEACRALGRHGEAARHLEESLSILGTIQSRPELGQSLLAYGRCKLMDDRVVGQDYLDRALRLFREIDADGWAAEARRTLIGSAG